MHIIKNITVVDTGIEFLKAIKQFFLTNTVAPFELVSENFDNSNSKNIFITVKRNKLYFDFVLNGSTSDSSVSWWIYDKSENILQKSSINLTCFTGCYLSSKVKRSINCFISYNNEFNVLQVGVSDKYDKPFVALKGNQSSSVFITYFENEDVLFMKGYIKKSVSLQDGSNLSCRSIVYNLSDITKLIVVDKVELYDTDLTQHIKYLQPLISVGNAEMGICYKISGENYLCIDDKICCPIGEKVEYTPPATEQTQ